MSLDFAGVSEAIQTFLKQPNATLFAGAGVAARAGLPTWEQYSEHLASVAEAHEPSFAPVIRDRIKSKRYIDAASLFMKCDMPESEKYRAIVSPFERDKYDASRLKALLSLPFSGIVTTNFDHSIHDAWSALGSEASPREFPLLIELDDPTMRRATYQTGFFIARIHGRAEVPPGIVMTDEGYRRLEEDDDYISFLYNLFSQRPLLFMGFSFVDPAINAVFDVLRRKRTPDVLPTHLALLPEGAADLSSLLATYNIATRFYQTSTDDVFSPHGQLWGGVSAAARAFSQAPNAARRERTVPAPLEPVRRALASVYVQSKMSVHLPALNEIVFSGMTAAVLAESGPSGMSRDDLVRRLDACLPLTPSEIDGLLDAPLTQLIQAGRITVVGDDKYVGKEIENTLEPAIAVLVEGVVRRIQVATAGRTKDIVTIDQETRVTIRDTVEDAVLLRGWELGAQFAGGSIPAAEDTIRALGDIVRRRGASLSEIAKIDVENACFSLFHAPEAGEASVLADLGRLAFGIDVVLQLGRSALLNPRALPQHIFLDASIALPLLANGHPYRPVYVDALARWQQHTTNAGRVPVLLIGRPFLDEILRHRELAQEIVAQQQLDDKGRLEKYVLLRGADHVNVFIGAYATAVAEGTAATFGEWLARSAPYDDEAKLIEFLSLNNINVASLEPPAVDDARFREIRDALENAYDRDVRSQYDPKAEVLIRHEALQLRALEAELRRGTNAVFVTADHRLRRLAVGSVLGYVGSGIISHLGLVQLLDLFVGLEADPQSLSRLLWGVHSLDERNALRDYLTSLALRRLDEATAMSLPTILDRLVGQALERAETEHVKLFRQTSVDDEARSARFLDRVENEFFQAIDEAIKKRKLEDAALRADAAKEPRRPTGRTARGRRRPN